MKLSVKDVSSCEYRTPSIMLSSGIVVDNSSLNKILKDDSILDYLSKLPINLIIPKETYLEAHAGTADYIYPRMVKLAKFNKLSKAARFFFVPSFFEILKRESRRGGVLNAIPALPPAMEARHFEIFSCSDRYKAFKENDLKDKTDWINGAKERVLQYDISRLPMDEFSDEQIAHIIYTFVGVNKISEMRRDFLPLFEEVISRSKIRAALGGGKHSHLKAYFNAIALRQLGNIICDFKPFEELLFLKDKKRGNWYDLYYIGWAAEKFNLLTEDTDLREMHQFLKVRGLIRTSALSIEQLLGVAKRE